jgi:hypothetical protein
MLGRAGGGGRIVESVIGQRLATGGESDVRHLVVLLLDLLLYSLADAFEPLHVFINPSSILSGDPQIVSALQILDYLRSTRSQLLRAFNYI